MKSLFNRLIVVSTVLVVLALILVFVASTEYNKKLRAISEARAAYYNYNESLKQSHEDYIKELEALRAQNNSDMQKLEKEYEDLLSKQPAIIAQHTRTKQQSETINSSSPIGVVTNSSNGNSKSSPTVVKKPKSTPSTRSS